jgi:RNA polymerase sigma-70 factor (ECF subfamily)
MHIVPDAAASDAALAARLRSGAAADVAALDALFRRHAPGLLRLAAGLTASHADAEDVVQDVFVGLDRALRGYEERGAFAAWLRGLTMRTALAHRRRAGRRREDALDTGAESRRATGDTADTLAVADALARLPDALRDVFTLRAVEGYSHAEIASLLGISVGASEVRHFRAVRRLRSMLSEAR